MPGDNYAPRLACDSSKNAESFLEQIGAAGLQSCAQYPIKHFASFAAHAVLRRSKVQRIFLSFLLGRRTRRHRRHIPAPDLVHGGIQGLHDMEAVNHVATVAEARSNDFQIRSPHIATYMSNAGQHGFSRKIATLTQRGRPAGLADPEQSAALVHQSDRSVAYAPALFTVAYVEFINTNRRYC